MYANGCQVDIFVQIYAGGAAAGRGRGGVLSAIGIDI